MRLGQKWWDARGQLRNWGLCGEKPSWSRFCLSEWKKRTTACKVHNGRYMFQWQPLYLLFCQLCCGISKKGTQGLPSPPPLISNSFSSLGNTSSCFTPSRPQCMFRGYSRLYTGVEGFIHESEGFYKSVEGYTVVCQGKAACRDCSGYQGDCLWGGFCGNLIWIVRYTRTNLISVLLVSDFCCRMQPSTDYCTLRIANRGG